MESHSLQPLFYSIVFLIFCKDYVTILPSKNKGFNAMKQRTKEFILILTLSAIIGVSVGFIVSLFHKSVDWILLHKIDIIHTYWPWEHYIWIAYMLLSSFMVFISVYLVKHFSPEAGGSGIQEIEGVVGNRRTMNAIRVIVVKFIGGLFSLGGSMAMGREGPSVQIGGALGQLIARSVKLQQKDINVLIAAGAGAGLAAAFNAPLAGLLFVLEEMRKEIHYSYIPVKSVMIATIMSIITLRAIVGNNISIPIDNLVVPSVDELWIFAIFGLFFGLLGFAFNRYLILFTTKIATLTPFKSNISTLFIGAFIGLLLFFYPDSVGEGYNAIATALHQNLGIEALLILFSVRFLTTLLSYGTGAPGGIFAPMLALGTLFGVAFGLAVDTILPSLALDPMVFAIVGMSALFSATVRAPITGIVLVAEMTGSFNLLMPLLITSLSAVIVANTLGGRAIYTVLLENTLKIAKFGKKIKENNDTNTQ